MNMSYQAQTEVWEMICRERQRKIDKFGTTQNLTPQDWLMALGEEMGETCRAVHDAVYEDGDEAAVTAELVQVAAVALAWLEERAVGISLCIPQRRRDCPPATSVCADMTLFRLLEQYEDEVRAIYSLPLRGMNDPALTIDEMRRKLPDLSNLIEDVSKSAHPLGDEAIEARDRYVDLCVAYVNRAIGDQERQDITEAIRDAITRTGSDTA